MKRGKTLSARLIALLGMVIAAAALVAGCGGGGDNSSTSGNSTSGNSSSASGGSTITKAVFIQKASAICEEERSKITKEFETYFQRHQGSGKSEEELLADLVKEVLIPSIQNDIDRLRKLGTPAGEESRVNAFLNAQQRAVDEMSKVKTLSQGPAGEKYLEPASRLAKAYGIRLCAQS